MGGKLGGGDGCMGVTCCAWGTAVGFCGCDGWWWVGFIFILVLVFVVLVVVFFFGVSTYAFFLFSCLCVLSHVSLGYIWGEVMGGLVGRGG